MRSMGHLAAAARPACVCGGIVARERICQPGPCGGSGFEHGGNDSDNPKTCEENQNGDDRNIATQAFYFWHGAGLRAGDNRLGEWRRLGVPAEGEEVQSRSELL